MREYTYEQHIERTRAAIQLRIDQAREHPRGSRLHGAFLGTAETLLTGLLRNVEVDADDETRLRQLILDERGSLPSAFSGFDTSKAHERADSGSQARTFPETQAVDFAGCST